MITRENSICFLCGRENNWNEQATAIAKEIRQKEFEKIFDDPFDPITTEGRIQNKLEEFWEEHKVPCLVLKEEGIIMFAMCKKHLQAEVDQL